ncbi:MAG: hypothetical protein IKH37_05525 [Prevotella sp.]|nr:hypothetical protein [Prevotella sp.]
MKKIVIFIMAVAAMLLSACSTSETATVAVGNVSNSECGAVTRAAIMSHPKIKMTRRGSNIDFELPCYVNCGWVENGIKVEPEWTDGRLNVILKPEKTFNSDIGFMCTCQVTVYFTAYDIEDDSFVLTVDGKNSLKVDLAGHGVVYIDQGTGDMAYEEGFSYQPELTGFNFTKKDKPVGIIPENSFIAQRHGTCTQFLADGYFVPCSLTQLSAKLDREDDGTLVLRYVTDAGEIDGRATDCNQWAYIFATIENTPDEEIHLKVNPHKAMVKGEDGVEHEETEYDFDGIIKKDGKVETEKILGYVDNPVLGKVPVVPVDMQSLPDWLKKKMQEMDSQKLEYAVFRGMILQVDPIYYIYSPLSSCLACEMYDERGDDYDYWIKDAKQKVDKVKSWRCIYSTK